MYHARKQNMNNCVCTINQTGIRDGEYITSTPWAIQNKGSIVQVLGYYPPFFDKEGLIATSELKTKGSTFDRTTFFASMTADERISYLEKNSKAYTGDKCNYLNKFDVKVKFIMLNGKFLVDNLGDRREEVVGNIYKINDILHMLGDPKSLVFRPSNWCLLEDYNEIHGFTGSVFDMTKNQLETVEDGTVDSVLNIGKKLLGVNFEKGMSNFTFDGCLSLLKRDTSEEKKVHNVISWFSPSVHKSLIQKLIRTRCKYVSYDDTIYSSQAVLTASFLMLLTCKGSFVHDIQKYVTGIEAACKRLAVSIFEDSYTPDINNLTSMMVAALCKQYIPEFVPSENKIKNWLLCALESQQDPRMYKYSSRETNRVYSMDSCSNLNALLLEDLKSFKTDINMVHSIALNKCQPVCEGPYKIIETMPIVHCIDHHSLTDIAYYTRFELESYEQLFDDLIWTCVTSQNARRNKHKNFTENDEIVREVRRAQSLVWLSNMCIQDKRKATEDTFKYSYTLPDSWLSSMIGSIEVKVDRITAIVVMKPDDIGTFIAVKKPSRGDEETLLTDEQTSEALRKIDVMLDEGILLNNVPRSLNKFKGAMLRIQKNDKIRFYSIQYANKTRELWEHARNLSREIDVIEPIEVSVLNSILYAGDGISADYDERIETLVAGLSKLALQRFMALVEGGKTEIKLPRIPRSGKGPTINIIDIDVFDFLCKLCVLVPSALRKDGTKFIVRDGPLFWLIRDVIVQGSSHTAEESEWKMDKVKERDLWYHQETSIDTLKERYNAGLRGSILWIPLGMGKTIITLRYIKWLIANKKMPKYCVWTGPMSSFESIGEEIRKEGLSHVKLDMRKNSKVRNFVQGKICLVHFDHLRLGETMDVLRDIAKDSLVVVDEFHNLFDATQRTSCGIELTKASKFFVCMSGTIIKDKNVENLLQWFEQIVEFEVTPHNYWCALATLISKRVETGVFVKRDIVECEVPKEYYSYVPSKLGGTAKEINIVKAANISFDAVTRHIVEIAYSILTQNDTPIFIVAKDRERQSYIVDELTKRGINSIYAVGSNNIKLNYVYGSSCPYKVFVTTPKYSEGYNLTVCNVLLTGVYFTNQATREQLSGRINRIGQKSNIQEIIVHGGLLTYVFEKYESCRSLSQAIKGFAEIINTDDSFSDM